MSIAPSEFLKRMTLPVRQAMAAVCWLEGRVRNSPKASEPDEAKAAVSEGDCVSQEVLLTALREHYPDVVLEAEEDTPTVAAFSGNAGPCTVHIDPVDGSLLYLRRSGLYAIIVGLECASRIEASLIAVPSEDVLVRAARGAGAEVSFGGGPFRPARLGENGARVLVSRGVSEPVRDRLREQGFELALASGGAIGIAPLLEKTRGAVRVSQASEGLSLRAWIAALPVQEAGGVVESLTGAFPDRYRPGVPGVIVAASAREIAPLRDLL